MSTIEYRAAIIGCGRMGQQYAKAYTTYPGTEIVAIAERCKVVGEHFKVCALYPEAESLVREVVPNIAVIVPPTKYMKAIVIACAEASVKGISTEKPIAGVLAEADKMVEACNW